MDDHAVKALLILLVGSLCSARGDYVVFESVPLGGLTGDVPPSGSIPLFQAGGALFTKHASALQNELYRVNLTSLSSTRVTECTGGIVAFHRGRFAQLGDSEVTLVLCGSALLLLPEGGGLVVLLSALSAGSVYRPGLVTSAKKTIFVANNSRVHYLTGMMGPWAGKPGNLALEPVPGDGKMFAFTGMDHLLRSETSESQRFLHHVLPHMGFVPANGDQDPVVLYPDRHCNVLSVHPLPTLAEQVAMSGDRKLECSWYSKMDCMEKSYWCQWVNASCTAKPCFAVSVSNGQRSLLVFSLSGAPFTPRDIYLLARPKQYTLVSDTVRSYLAKSTPSDTFTFVGSDRRIWSIQAGSVVGAPILSVKSCPSGDITLGVAGEVFIIRYYCRVPCTHDGGCPRSMVFISDGTTEGTRELAAVNKRSQAPPEWGYSPDVMPLYPSHSHGRVYFVVHLPSARNPTEHILHMWGTDVSGGEVVLQDVLCEGVCPPARLAPISLPIRLVNATKDVEAVVYFRDEGQLWATAPQTRSRPSFAGSWYHPNLIAALVTTGLLAVTTACIFKFSTRIPRPFDGKSPRVSPRHSEPPIELSDRRPQPSAPMMPAADPVKHRVSL